MVLERKPYSEWTVAELKAVARKYNVKMSAADGSPRSKRGLYQAIAAALQGHGAVRKSCHGTHGGGWCRKPGTLRSPGRKLSSPRRVSRSPCRKRRSPRRVSRSPCGKRCSPRRKASPRRGGGSPGRSWRYSDTRAGRVPRRRPLFTTAPSADLTVPYNLGDSAIVQHPHQNMDSLIDEGKGPGYGLDANYAAGASVPNDYSYFGPLYNP